MFSSEQIIHSKLMAKIIAKEWLIFLALLSFSAAIKAFFLFVLGMETFAEIFGVISFIIIIWKRCPRPLNRVLKWVGILFVHAIDASAKDYDRVSKSQARSTMINGEADQVLDWGVTYSDGTSHE